MPTTKLWLYPGANPNLTPTSWAPYEVDISQYVRRPGSDGGAPISYSWGKQDESTQTDAGQMTLTLDNRDGRFSTDKIDGQYYGLLDVNTPIRLGVQVCSDNFNRTVSSSAWGTIDSALSQTWAVSGSATYSVNGSRGEVIIPSTGIAPIALAVNCQARDMDIVSSVIPLATATGASYGMGHVVRRTDNSNLVYSTLEFNTAGDVTVKIRRILAGVTVELTSLNPIPSTTYSAGVAWKLRTQVDGDTIRVKAWPAAGSEPTSWHIAADEGDNAGTTIAVVATRFAGNTNSAVAAVMAIDDFTLTALEWTGYVVSWPLRWDQTGRNSWAPITAGGVLRRLRQGTNPIQSPLRRQLGATADVSGYWPMEEGSASKYFLGAAGANVPVASFSGVTPAQDNSLAGGGPAPTITTTGGSIVAKPAATNGGSGMAAMVLINLGSLPSVKTRIIRVRTNRGPGVIYDWSIDNAGNTTVDVYDALFNVLGTVVNAPGVDFTKGWVALQLDTNNVSNTAWEWGYNAVGSPTFFVQSGTVTGGQTTNAASMELTGPTGTSFAHIWMGRNTFPFFTTTFNLVSSGYAGETAAARFGRVCGEAGLPYSIGGPNSLIASSEAMGAQKEASTLAVLQACIDADYGALTERGAGVEMIPRNARWNLASALSLTVASGQIAEVPEPTRDDQRLRNKWTITRVNGGSGSFQDDASIARNGTWEDSAQLNVFDDSVLINHAAWRTNIGIQHRVRWPSVAIDLVRNATALLPAWRSRYYGWRVALTTGLLQVTGNEPDVVMEGYQATLTPETWTVEMNATDARVWAAAVTDDTGILGRVDMDAGQCTLTTALTSTTTGANMPITTATGYVKWDITAGLWSGGVDLNVGGERITVNAITNGAGQAQTFTITARGVNGYAAAHAIGTAVSLWFPAVAAL